MRRFSLVLLALVVLWAPPASGEEKRIYTEGLLWRVESQNAPASYVFGTIHISDRRVQAVVQDMLQTVGPLDSISLEIVQSPATMAAAAQRMFDLQGPPLSQRVGAQLFSQTVAAAAPYGLNATVLERFKPWAVAVTLSLPVSELRAQASGELNSEKLLEAHATSNRIALYGIETIDDQLGLFDGLSEAEQVDMLRLTLQNSRKTGAIFTRLVNAYLAQDLNDFYRVMEEFSVGQESNLQEFFEGQMIAGRNRQMVERIQPRLAEGNALIAVGALHLPDEVGVLRLLEQRGYTISPMPR
ncbi:MAG: TraB/GumN family protein [Alphaproteobacteria bacterium]|nr:TraB/GumN family protein [Alphaproteobacteria bacterium]